MSKQTRPSFATAAVAEITGNTPPVKNPDEALWPNAGIIRPAAPAAPVSVTSKDDKDGKVYKYEEDNKEVKPQKITFSNKYISQAAATRHVWWGEHSGNPGGRPERIFRW
jgi:hypothetical protein